METPDISTSPTWVTSDSSLIARAAAGEADAYAELWRRHYLAATRAARAITSSIEADDLVQEAFTRIYRLIRSGHGPKQAFRSYLYSAIRNTSATWGKRNSKEVAFDEFDSLEDSRASEFGSESQTNAALALKAFYSLPARWQEVLWYLEVEGMKPAGVAEIMGGTAHAISQLAVRAREGLRDAWVTVHLASVDPDTECHWVTTRLGGFMRSKSGVRDGAKIEQHLTGCGECQAAAREAEHVASRLRTVALPVVLGVAGAAAFAYPTQVSASSAVVFAQPAVPALREGIIAPHLQAIGKSDWVGWKWAGVTMLAGAVVTAGLLLALGRGQELAETDEQQVTSTSRQAEKVESSTPSGATVAEQIAPELSGADVDADPDPVSFPAPAAPPTQAPELQPHAAPKHAPSVWNTSSTALADGSYSITVMLGGESGTTVVALLDDIEVARAEGPAPQLSFIVATDQYASAALRFMVVSEGSEGASSGTHTPQHWCER